MKKILFFSMFFLLLSPMWAAEDEFSAEFGYMSSYKEARAKATETTDDLGTVRRGDCRLDGVDGAGALVDVHSRVGVGHVPGLV